MSRMPDRTTSRLISLCVVCICAFCCIGIFIGIYAAVRNSNDPPRLMTTQGGGDSVSAIETERPESVQQQPVPIVKRDEVKRSISVFDKTPVFTTNVAIIGGGAGGIASAYFATDAFHRKGLSKAQMSVSLFEANEHLGGNVKQAELIAPTDYDGSFGRRLMADLASDRSPLNTLGLKRRLYSHLNVSVFYTPFKNYFNSRGHTAECEAPNVKATALFAKLLAEKGAAYMTSPEAIGRLSAAFINRCIYNAEFTDPEKGAVFGDVFGQGVTKPAQDILPDAYNWLLAGLKFQSFSDQWRLNGSTPYDWPTPDVPITHPAQSEKSCKIGVDCVSDVVRALTPASVVHTLTGIAHSFGWEPERTLNYALAWYLVANEVSAGGSWIEDTGFATFLTNQLREYGHTNDIYGFPLGGDRQLLIKMIRAAEHKGARFFTSERVLSVDKVSETDGAGIKFKLTTNKRVVLVRDVLIGNLSPYYLFNGSTSGHAAHSGTWPGAAMSGSLIEKLRTMPEIRQPVHQEVLRIVIQFQPGVRAWFRDLFTPDGQYSVRKFGIEGDSCFATMEFVDVPYKSCTNEVVVGFKCHKCQVRFEALVHEAKHDVFVAESLLQLAWDEIRAAWPKHASAIPKPVRVLGASFPAGRHMGSRKYDFISNSQVAHAARQPFPGVPFAMVGEAYQTDYQGWMEAALLTAEAAVEQHIAVLPGMDKATKATFYHIYSIMPELNVTMGFSDASRTSSFAIIPPLYAAATPPIEVPSKYLLKNEFWWPHANVELFLDYKFDFCRADNYNLGSFVLVE
jgi:hypothetical protein